MKNQNSNNSSINEYYFNQSSFLSGEDSNSYLEVGLDMTRFEQKDPQNNSHNQLLDFDEEALEKYPILFNETMKIFQARSIYPELARLAQQYKEAEKQQAVDEDANVERSKLTQEFKQLKQQVDNIIENNQKTAEENDQLFEKNKSLIFSLIHLRGFVKEMTQDKLTSPFARITDKHCIKSIKKVRNFENNLTQSKIPLTKDQIIEKRLKSIQQYEQLDQELKGLIEFESNKLNDCKKQIKESKQNRDLNIKLDDNNQEINLKLNIIPNEIEKIIQKVYDTTTIQQIKRPLQEYLSEIEELQKKKISTEAKLKFQESILAEKINKNSLLQKQSKQMEIELKKLKNQSQAQTEDETEGESVNYQELILKTYELKQTKKMAQRLDDQALQNGVQYPKRAKRIVIEQQALTFTQKVFPSIKTYKQLINWLLVLWLVLIALFFVQKTLVRSDMWFSPSYDEPALKIQQQPVIHKMQTKHKLNNENLINNKSIHFDEVKEERKIQNDPFLSDVFEIKRKHMEQVNAGRQNDEDDWKSKLASEFE